MSSSIDLPSRRIHISIDRQHLRWLDGGRVLFEAPVSTATNGPGEHNGSECTPRGLHRICARIGAGCAPNTVFRGRRPTGEIYSPGFAERFPGRDWILTRILWLGGLEPGFNRGGVVDTLRRYVYIHGAPDATPMGVPGSHGCVRMHNEALIELFDRVQVGDRVLIESQGL